MKGGDAPARALCRPTEIVVGVGVGIGIGVEFPGTARRHDPCRVPVSPTGRDGAGSAAITIPTTADAWVVVLCSDPERDPGSILQTYALRWGVEVYFKEVKQHLRFVLLFYALQGSGSGLSWGQMRDRISGEPIQLSFARLSRELLKAVIHDVPEQFRPGWIANCWTGSGWPWTSQWKSSSIPHCRSMTGRSPWQRGRKHSLTQRDGPERNSERKL
jgi:hypothetical protein